MKLQNINCEYIRVLSSAYEKAYISDSIKSVEITGSINGGTAVTRNILISSLSNVWVVTIGFNANTKITQLYVRNVVTGVSFPLLPAGTKLAVTENNLTMMKALVTETLQTELQITGVVQTYEILTGSILKISISRLPANMVVDFMTTVETEAETNKLKYAYYLDDDDVIFNGNNLLIKPSFFDLEEFDDGVYKIVLRSIDDAGVVTREETCYFMDCRMSGSIISAVNLEECNETDIRTLMLHYSLRIASNRQCDCDEMQKIFDFLEKHIDTSNTDPCGC